MVLFASIYITGWSLSYPFGPPSAKYMYLLRNCAAHLDTVDVFSRTITGHSVSHDFWKSCQQKNFLQQITFPDILKLTSDCQPSRFCLLAFEVTRPNTRAIILESTTTSDIFLSLFRSRRPAIDFIGRLVFKWFLLS